MADAPTDAPGVQALLGDAGAPAEIHTGSGDAARVWKVGHPTQKAKAVLEELVTQHARKALLATGDPNALSAWLDRVEAGEYRTLRPGWVRVTRGPDGGALFLAALLRTHHPDATPADAAALAEAEPEQVKAATLRVAPQLFRLLAESAGLPPETVRAVAAEAMAALSGLST